jgi:ABC-2 type transport system permease protein
MSFDITPPNPGERQKAKGESVSPPPLPSNATPSTQPSTSSLASPIADLSYRNYDGPLHTRALRWWTITIGAIRLNFRKVGFWVIIALSCLPHLFTMIGLYLQGQMAAAVPAGMLGATIPKYADNFFQALQFQLALHFLFILALTVGSGSIAADNRANALLVYLSKPITKGDYLLGKWMSIFLVLFVVAFVPALVLYLYCLLSFLGQGFLKNEPWLLLQILGAAMVPGAIHASLLIGFSAWSKTPRLAGAAYAGVYFVGNILAGLIGMIRHRGDMSKAVLEMHLSINGVIQGLAQNIFQVNVTPQGGPRRMGTTPIELAPPELWVMLLVGAVMVVIGVMAARMRIRAVEVVRG